jgi:hypothetical protein
MRVCLSNQKTFIGLLNQASFTIIYNSLNSISVLYDGTIYLIWVLRMDTCGFSASIKGLTFKS